MEFLVIAIVQLQCRKGIIYWHVTRKELKFVRKVRCNADDLKTSYEIYVS